MTNSREKGARYERALKTYLTSRGLWAIRHYQRVAGNRSPDLTAGTDDGSTMLRIEAKDRKSIPLAKILSALEQATSSVGAGQPAVLVKQPGSPVGDSIVFLRLEDLLTLAKLPKVSASAQPGTGHGQKVVDIMLAVLDAYALATDDVDAVRLRILAQVLRRLSETYVRRKTAKKKGARR